VDVGELLIISLMVVNRCENLVNHGDNFMQTSLKVTKLRFDKKVFFKLISFCITLISS